MRFLLSILLLGFMLDGMGQITFEKNLSGPNNEFFNPTCIKSSTENKFIIAGNRVKNGINSVFLMKTNEFGDTVWIKDFSVSANHYSFVRSLELLDDGYIIYCIWQESTTQHKNYLIKTDLEGELSWSKCYNTSVDVSWLSKFIKLENGGFAISGYGAYPNFSNYLLKIDDSGNVVFGKKYFNADYTNNFSNIIELLGKFYIITRNGILKLDSNGDILSYNRILNENNTFNSPVNITKTNDNKMFVGSLRNNSYNSVSKIDTSLSINWTKNIGQHDELITSIFQTTNDGGIIFSTSGSNCDNNSCDYYANFHKLDANGDYQKYYDLPGQDKDFYFTSITETAGNGFAAVCYNSIYSRSDFYKIDSLLSSSCHEGNSGSYINQTSIFSIEEETHNYSISDEFADSSIVLNTFRGAGNILAKCNSISNIFTSDTTYVSACGSYSLNGQTYTSSGDYTQLIPNQTGTFDTLSLVVDIVKNSSSISFITACNEYEFYDCEECGESESGFYPNVYTIQNTAGCDSLISVDLTIIPRVNISIYDTGCLGYVFRNLVFNNSGIYIVNTENGPLCDTAFTLHLTMYDWNTASINSKFNILTAPKTNATYKWIDCATNTPIPGATNQTFAPSFNGSYAVEMSFANCQGTTDCFEYVYVELPPTTFEIFPNPFTSEAKIVFNVPQTNTKIQLLDVLGKELQSVSFSGTEYTIYRESLSASMYFVQITDPSGKIATKKIVLE
jgi:hypothetical protein